MNNFTTQEAISILTELKTNSEAIKNIIKDSIGIVKEYVNEIKPILDGLNDYIIEKTLYTIARYQQEGFTKEEAIIITLNQKDILLKSLQQSSKKK